MLHENHFSRFGVTGCDSYSFNLGATMRDLDKMEGLAFVLAFATGEIVTLNKVTFRILSIERESGFYSHSYNAVLSPVAGGKAVKVYCRFGSVNRITVLGEV